MEDLISRQAAIDALGDAPEVWTESPEELAEVSQWEMDVAAIMAVPSADWDLPSIQAEHYAQGFADGYKRGMKDADRPSGEWIKATGMMPPEFHSHHCCSECGNFANMEPPLGNREELSKFCPNCGAKMENGEA